MIIYDTATQPTDLEQILALQKSNIPQALTEEEWQKEGFVTVHHTLPLLQAMNQPYPHIIARDKDRVIAYALVMLREFEKTIPVLVPMFEQINMLMYAGQPLAKSEYVVMGQICIAKEYRGKGIFDGLYQKYKAQLSGQFTYLITEVSKRNPRSIRAHTKVGFQPIGEYQANNGEDWIIFLWDWR